MCYYNGQRVTRAEYIELKGLAKPVRNYDFLNVGVHNGFNYAPCAIAIPSEDGRDFEIVQAEWGYVPGTIKDIITKVLKEQNAPLHKDEVVKQVLAQRLVAKNTVLMNLNNKNNFGKDSNDRYFIKGVQQS